MKTIFIAFLVILALLSANAVEPIFTTEPASTEVVVGTPFTYTVTAEFSDVGVPTDIVLGPDAPAWLALEASFVGDISESITHPAVDIRFTNEWTGVYPEEYYYRLPDPTVEPDNQFFDLIERGDGSILIVDSKHDVIRQRSERGVLGTETVFVGQQFQPGSADGTGTDASFRTPTHIARDSAGNYYVTDYGNHTIRRITPAGAVSTYAGQPGVAGSTNGDRLVATFNFPYGIVIDGQDRIFVSDSGSHTIRLISPTGEVSLYAGQLDLPGFQDGAALNARFNKPTGLEVDPFGNLYVADKLNHVIRRISPGGAVVTVYGEAGMPYGASPTANQRLSFPHRLQFGEALPDQVRGILDVLDRLAAGDPFSSLAPGVAYLDSSGIYSRLGRPLRDEEAVEPYFFRKSQEFTVWASEVPEDFPFQLKRKSLEFLIPGLAGIPGTTDDTEIAVVLRIIDVRLALNENLDYDWTLQCDIYVRDQGTDDDRNLENFSRVVTLSGDLGVTGTFGPPRMENSYAPTVGHHIPFNNVPPGGTVNLSSFTPSNLVASNSTIGTVNTFLFNFRFGSRSNEMASSLNGSDLVFNLLPDPALVENPFSTATTRYLFVQDNSANLIKRLEPIFTLSGTPTAENLGLHDVTLIAGSGGNTSEQELALAVVAPDPFASLSKTNATSDEDQDAVSFLEEFLFDGSPTQPDSGTSFDPMATMTGAELMALDGALDLDAESEYAVFDLRVRRERRGITLTPELSFDLSFGDAPPVDVIQVGAAIPDGDYDILRYVIAEQSTTLPPNKAFLRLNIDFSTLP